MFEQKISLCHAHHFLKERSWWRYRSLWVFLSVVKEVCAKSVRSKESDLKGKSSLSVLVIDWREIVPIVRTDATSNLSQIQASALWVYTAFDAFSTLWKDLLPPAAKNWFARVNRCHTLAYCCFLDESRPQEKNIPQILFAMLTVSNSQETGKFHFFQKRKVQSEAIYCCLSGDFLHFVPTSNPCDLGHCPLPN